MKIKTKLTLLIACGMMFFALVFLIAGTIFSIHEVLLVKRHDSKTVARRIDHLMSGYSAKDIKKIRQDIIGGVRFAEKKGRLEVTIFDSNGKFILNTDNKGSRNFVSKNYSKQTRKFRESIHWISWNYWKVDYHYSGVNCYVKLNLLQRLEIHEDILLFFFSAMPIITLLSFFGGWIITSRILRRAERIETVASQIASGNLNYRIPISKTEDEIKMIEDNLNYSFSELEKSFHQIMDFSSDIAHELRTPLTIINGELEVALRETRSSEEYQTTMVHVLEEISLLRKIIDDMLILIKPEAAYKTEQPDSFNISEIIAETIVSYKLIADSKNITIESEIEPNIVINASGSLLNLIFSNLIYNAIKFTQKSGHIKIKLLVNKRSIEFSVSDNGPGIPREEHEKIFSRFYRLKTDQNKQGTGLGLAIVKKICDINNATVTVKSIPGKGSTFTVQFKQESLASNC